MKTIAVVGAGPAGCVAASQLVLAGFNVHLLERGPGRDTASAERSSQNFMNALSQPKLLDASCFARANEESNWFSYLRGNALGGTSAINAMVQMWGAPDDYRKWDRELGCTGWDWPQVRREFAELAMESFVAQPQDLGGFSRQVIEAAISIGAQQCVHNGPTADGAGPVALSLRNGARNDAFGAYIEPLINDPATRSRITVRTDAEVASVVVANGTAKGVVFLDGSQETFDGVVLCAGALWSPLLLKRSGLAHAALGRNLKDHASLTITVQLAQPEDVGSAIVTSLVVGSSPSGESDIHLLPGNAVPTPNGAMWFAQLTAAIAQVSSSGYVEEVDGEARATLNTLDTADDQQRMMSALHLAADLLDTDEGRDGIVETYVDDVGTTLKHLLAHDQKTIINFIRRQPGAYSHAAGTCAMGPASSPHSVVGVVGNVHGVESLWVADASVFPELPRAATQMPAMMVARRIATGIGSVMS
jgi:choline dehydrogenase-like flavoprotein